MEIKISKCDTVNKNNILYPLKEMKKCVSAFNKLSPKDSKRNVYFYSDDDHSATSLGKIKKLKVKDGIVYADFEFSDNELAQDVKAFCDECLSKGVNPSHFDYRVMMDVEANVDTHEDYRSANDIEVHSFVFGLDSCWR